MVRWIPYIVIALLLAIIWFQGCEREVIEIEVPGKDGRFDTIREVKYIPYPEPVPDIRWKDSIIPAPPNPVNLELIEKYQEATDSIVRLNMFINAIQERQFAQTFEDEYLRATASGLVRGELLGLSLDYTIKPRTIEAPQTRFRVLGGFSIGNNTELSGFRWKASMGLQNAQGNIFRLGYGSGETIWMGYEASLLNF